MTVSERDDCVFRCVMYIFVGFIIFCWFSLTCDSMIMRAKRDAYAITDPFASQMKSIKEHRLLEYNKLLRNNKEAEEIRSIYLEQGQNQWQR